MSLEFNDGAICCVPLPLFFCIYVFSLYATQILKTHCLHFFQINVIKWMCAEECTILNDIGECFFGFYFWKPLFYFPQIRETLYIDREIRAKIKGPLILCCGYILMYVSHRFNLRFVFSKLWIF